MIFARDTKNSLTALVKLYERLNFFSYYVWNFGALQQPEFGTKYNEIWSALKMHYRDQKNFCPLLKRPNMELLYKREIL
jgi:hypothetical protein